MNNSKVLGPGGFYNNTYVLSTSTNTNTTPSMGVTAIPWQIQTYTPGSMLAPTWSLKEKNLFELENVVVRRIHKRYQIETDRYVIIINSTIDAMRIYNVGGSDQVLFEAEITPEKAFDMFVQHSDGEIHYANAMDINIKIENLLML